MNSKKLNEYISTIDNALGLYADKTACRQNKLISAAKYSLEAGGKRIRPMLLLEFTDILGGDKQAAMPIACALEMMHTFSLIHDDLPCMDNDDMRRGKPSCHKAYGESTALLAGDFLSVAPYQLISESSFDSKIKMELVRLFAVNCCGMIDGQQIDTDSNGVIKESAALINMYSLKTACLLKIACCGGCICAGADEEKIRLAEEYALMLGLAFQIQDDILDVTGDADVLGKPIGSDAENRKSTYVSMFGLDAAYTEAKRLTDNALEIIDKFDNNEFLKYITNILLDRKK